MTTVANDGVLSWDPARWIAAVVLVLALGAVIYVLLPERPRSADAEPSRLARSITTLGWLRNSVLYLFFLGVAVAYLIGGNSTGRLVGVALLSALLIIGIRLVWKHR